MIISEFLNVVYRFLYYFCKEIKVCNINYLKQSLFLHTLLNVLLNFHINCYTIKLSSYHIANTNLINKSNSNLKIINY